VLEMSVKNSEYQAKLNVPHGKFGAFEVKDLRSARAMLDSVAESESQKGDVSEKTAMAKKCVFDFVKAIGQQARDAYDNDNTHVNYDNRNQDIPVTVAEFLAVCKTVEGDKTVVCRAWIDTKSKIKRSLMNGVDLNLSTKEMREENIQVEKTDEKGILIHIPSNLDMLSNLMKEIAKQEGKTFSGSQLEKQMNNDLLKLATKWQGHIKTEQNAEQIEVAQKVVNG
jgi:hypothetical protein